MPVFLAYVRGHGALDVGKVMLVTGIVQLAAAPIAVALEQRYDERFLTALGFLIFGMGLALSCIDTINTDYDGMFWPQVLRGAALMLCILPPTRLALGHIAKDSIPDASGLFNMMRNLGGAIGIALIDTVIYSRAPVHGRQIFERIAAGDVDTMRSIGVPPDLMGPALLGPQAKAMLAPLVDKAAFVEAVNDAWGLVALITLIAILCVPAARAPVWSTVVSLRQGRVLMRRERT